MGMWYSFMRLHSTLKTGVSTASVAMMLDGTNPCPPAIVPGESAGHAPAGMAAAFASLVSKSIKSVCDRVCPIGYEDETGFHYGEQK
jgi:hypothetical protein